MPEDYVTMSLFDERTQHIQESIASLRSDVHQLSEDLKVVPELRLKVAEHEQFLSKLKTWGLRVLIGLAGSAVGAVSVTEFKQWIGF